MAVGGQPVVGMGVRLQVGLKFGGVVVGVSMWCITGWTAAEGGSRSVVWLYLKAGWTVNIPNLLYPRTVFIHHHTSGKNHDSTRDGIRHSLC